jgi:hypothetical protein
MEFPFADQDTSSSKTFPVSSAQRQETENRYSNMSSETWNKEVIHARGEYSQRKKLALLTKGSESSSWPTPQASEEKANRHRNNPNAKGSQVWLTTKVMDNWATPQASDHVEGARTAPESNQKCLGRDLNQMKWPTASTSDSEGGPQADRVEWTEKGARLRKKGKKEMVYGAKLRDAVENHENWPTPRAGNPGSRKPGTGGKILAEEAKKNWGTPQARDWKGAQGRAYKGGAKDLPAQTEGVPPHNGPPAPEKSNLSGKNHGSPKLNPNWVEQLMGLPVGWTQLPTGWIDSDCSETE